jgi:hypothetical protein
MIPGHLSVVVAQSCVPTWNHVSCLGRKKRNEPTTRVGATPLLGGVANFSAIASAENEKTFALAEDYRKFGFARFNSATFHRFAPVFHDVRSRPRGGIAAVSDVVL